MDRYITHTSRLKFTPPDKRVSGNDQAGRAGEVYFASLLSPGVFYWLADLV